ncbi:MAG: hypothetical protein HY744_14695 [Deltaproteobacteria bacterium]|nr:hypothetical protein [Deltaproteobacteria bacterium]
MVARPVMLAIVIALWDLVACAQTCPGGRTRAANGECVLEEVIDFRACLQAAGKQTVSQEELAKIEATALQFGASAEWKSRVLSQFSGPNEVNQRAVIERSSSAAQAATDALLFGALAPAEHDEWRELVLRLCACLRALAR